MWLHLGTHWLNMARACVVQDDTTCTPPMVTVAFAIEGHRSFTGAEREQVLSWLETQHDTPPPYSPIHVMMQMSTPEGARFSRTGGAIQAEMREALGNQHRREG